MLWSVRIAFGAPNLHIKDLTNASAGGVVESGPTISSETLSKVSPGVSVRTIGYLVFVLDSF